MGKTECIVVELIGTGIAVAMCVGMLALVEWATGADAMNWYFTTWMLAGMLARSDVKLGTLKAKEAP